jgi:hypothetical protein
MFSILLAREDRGEQQLRHPDPDGGERQQHDHPGGQQARAVLRPARDVVAQAGRHPHGEQEARELGHGHERDGHAATVRAQGPGADDAAHEVRDERQGRQQVRLDAGTYEAAFGDRHAHQPALTSTRSP